MVNGHNLWSHLKTTKMRCARNTFVRVYFVYVRINYANIMIGDINVHKFYQIDLRASRIIWFYEEAVVFRKRRNHSGYYGDTYLDSE